INIGVDSDGPEAEPTCRPHHPTGDLAPVCYQHCCELAHTSSHPPDSEGVGADYACARLAARIQRETNDLARIARIDHAHVQHLPRRVECALLLLEMRHQCRLAR